MPYNGWSYNVLFSRSQFGITTELAAIGRVVDAIRGGNIAQLERINALYAGHVYCKLVRV